MAGEDDQLDGELGGLERPITGRHDPDPGDEAQPESPLGPFFPGAEEPGPPSPGPRAAETAPPSTPTPDRSPEPVPPLDEPPPDRGERAPRRPFARKAHPEREAAPGDPGGLPLEAFGASDARGGPQSSRHRSGHRAGPDPRTRYVADRLEVLAERLRNEGPPALYGEVRMGDRFDALLAGMVAGYLAAGED